MTEPDYLFVGRCLHDLRFHWSDAYDIDAHATDKWTAVRRDNQRLLAASEPAVLRDLIVADYTREPVPRDMLRRRSPGPRERLLGTLTQHTPRGVCVMPGPSLSPPNPSAQEQLARLIVDFPRWNIRRAGPDWLADMPIDHGYIVIVLSAAGALAARMRELEQQHPAKGET